MQIIKSKHIELDISFTTPNPLKWEIEIYKNAWVREDMNHKSYGMKLVIADIGPFNIYFQTMTRRPIDDELWEGTWPGKGWVSYDELGYWSKWRKWARKRKE